MLIGKYDLVFNDNFYPADLPKDWYFDYYSNQFDCILLSNTKSLDLDEILEDIEDNFTLILELNTKNKIYINKDIIFWCQCSDSKEAQNIIQKTINISIQSNHKLDIDLPFIQIDKTFIYYNKKAVFLTKIPENNLLIRKQIEKLPSDICLIYQTNNSDQLVQTKTITQLLGL